MKQKIKEALKQQYGTRANKELGQLQLGLSDEVFERVAASVETFITDESQIAGFVASENTLNLLKSYQSMADKIRDLERVNPQPNNEPPKPSDNGNQPQPKTDPEPQGEMAQLIKLMQEQNEQMRKQNEALTARFDAFEAERNAKSAFSTAEATFKGNDYVKKYADEATDAWERATEMYEATGKKWNAQELQEKAMGYFNRAVAKKGVDTSKPFESDGGGGETDADFSSFERAAQKLGWIEPDK